LLTGFKKVQTDHKEDLKKLHSHHENTLWQMEKIKDEFETKYNVDLVRDRIDKFANIEHIDKI